jgi:hypothetical protein
LRTLVIGWDPIRDHDTPFGQEFLDIAEAEREPEVHPHGTLDDVAGEAVAGVRKREHAVQLRRRGRRGKRAGRDKPSRSASMVRGRGARVSASTQAYHDPNHKPQTGGNEPEGAQQEEESGVTQQALPHESSGERQPEHQPAAYAVSPNSLTTPLGCA